MTHCLCHSDHKEVSYCKSQFLVESWWLVQSDFSCCPHHSCRQMYQTWTGFKLLLLKSCFNLPQQSHYVFWFSVRLFIPFLWTWYHRNSLKQFLHIWNNRSLELKDKILLVKGQMFVFQWSHVSGFSTITPLILADTTALSVSFFLRCLVFILKGPTLKEKESWLAVSINVTLIMCFRSIDINRIKHGDVHAANISQPDSRYFNTSS